MYLYVERIRDFWGLSAIEIYFFTYLLTYLLSASRFYLASHFFIVLFASHITLLHISTLRSIL